MFSSGGAVREPSRLRMGRQCDVASWSFDGSGSRFTLVLAAIVVIMD